MMERGQGYYSNRYLFFSMLATVDVGMIAVPSADITFPGFPYVDFVFNFGQ